jgi:hypothetical protein
MADELKHVGILGMKWGRRKSRSANSIPSSDHTTARGLQKKHVSELSNDELKKLTTRLQLEKQYKDLKKTDLSFGRKLANDMLLETGKSIAKGYITKYATAGMDKLISNVLKKKPLE